MLFYTFDKIRLSHIFAVLAQIFFGWVVWDAYFIQNLFRTDLMYL